MCAIKHHKIVLVPPMSQVRTIHHAFSFADLESAAAELGVYTENGLYAFDMADHYGSAEVIVGNFMTKHGGKAVAMTKWCPEPVSLQ